MHLHPLRPHLGEFSRFLCFIVCINLRPMLTCFYRMQSKNFRIPTKTPLTESAYWITHDEGFFGAAVDRAQAQDTYIMNLIDTNLREATKGGITAVSGPRVNAFKGERRYGGIDHLRRRLEALNWAWSNLNNEDLEGEEEATGPAGEVEGASGDEVFVAGYSSGE